MSSVSLDVSCSSYAFLQGLPRPYSLLFGVDKHQPAHLPGGLRIGKGNLVWITPDLFDDSVDVSWNMAMISLGFLPPFVEVVGYFENATLVTS